MEFVPLVGPLLAAAIAVTVTSFHSLDHALWVLIFLLVVRVVQDYVIYPRLIGHGIHLHPFAVILAVVCGAELAGIAGIFLSIPVVAIVSVGYKHWLEHRGSEGLVAELLAPPVEATPPRCLSPPNWNPRARVSLRPFRRYRFAQPELSGCLEHAIPEKRLVARGDKMLEDKLDDQPSLTSNAISDETGPLDVRFALWRKFCAENGVPVESLPSELSGEAKAEWEKLKERDLLKPNSS